VKQEDFQDQMLQRMATLEAQRVADHAMLLEIKASMKNLTWRVVKIAAGISVALGGGISLW